MSLISRNGLLHRIRRGRRARAQLVESNLSEGIAFQIRATRDAHRINQIELAQAIGMSQNNLSRLENPDYGKHTISSLKRIADALDVALIVRFVPFSRYLDWLSGTPRIDPGLTASALAVPSFQMEEESGAFHTRDWTVIEGKAVKTKVREQSPWKSEFTGRSEIEAFPLENAGVPERLVSTNAS